MSEDKLTASEEMAVQQFARSDRQLRAYWTRGEGAVKIRWGTDGSFDRCVRQLGKYVRDPQGLCAEYHKEATGEWPAEKGVESADDVQEFHGSHDQSSHGNRGDDDSTSAEREYERQRDSRRVIELEEKEDTGVLTPRERRELDELQERLYGKKPHRPTHDHDGFTLTSAAEAPTSDSPWEGVLAVENVESGDGRMFAGDSLEWPDLPIPLQYQPASVGGHDGSVTVGEIHEIARVGEQIRGWGVVFASSLAGEHGDGIRNTMRVGGVSVDVDSVKNAHVEMIYSDDGGGLMSAPELTIFNKGRIRGATLVAFPAFVEAKLSFTGDDVLTASLEDDELVDHSDCACVDPLIASATHTITIPNLPPAHWFEEPKDVELSGALTITDDGRVYGVVAPANTRHRNYNTQVPRGVDFSRFHKGETIVEGGARVVTGVITADCGHAPTENYGTLNDRRMHYDNSCSVLANVRVGYSDKGYIWVAGALNAGAKPYQVAQALGCTLSLDVQPHPDKPGVREFIAAHLVPVPGFPMAREKASVQFEDGVVVASSVPIHYEKKPRRRVENSAEALTAVKSAKLLLARRLGLDPATRKAALAAAIQGDE